MVKTNVLFLLIDGFRADKCFGDKKTSVTPNIDSLTKNMERKLNKIFKEKITFEKSENTITDDEREQAIEKLRKLGYL
tara:strand:- start:500 stop:733 length:234 start_codon:yes stop_codon:yes gene_type:complete